jgi:hypothetical protein
VRTDSVCGPFCEAIYPRLPMHRLLPLLLILVAAPAAAQHAGHGPPAGADAQTGLALGLRVDAQNPPPGSAIARAFAFVDDAYVHVVYGSPFKRGRVVFGGLVGYGSLWPIGAHYATEITVTDSVRVAGHPLAPGTYSLFVTPEEQMWTLHINSALGMHQADGYDPAEDVHTIRVPVERLESTVEQLTIDFEPAENGADMRITWDQTRVRLPIRPPVR